MFGNIPLESSDRAPMCVRLRESMDDMQQPRQVKASSQGWVVDVLLSRKGGALHCTTKKGETIHCTAKSFGRPKLRQPGELI